MKEVKLKYAVRAYPYFQRVFLNKTEAIIAGSFAAWHHSDAYNYKKCPVNDTLTNGYTPDFRNSLVQHLFGDWGATNKQQFNASAPIHAHAYDYPPIWPADLDIFTFNWKDFDQVGNNLIKAGHSLINTSEFSYTYGSNYYERWHLFHLEKRLPRFPIPVNMVNSLKLPVQVIKPKFKDIKECMSQFDFTVCQVALLNSQDALIGEETEKHEEGRLIKLTEAGESRWPLHLLYRFVKYHKKGYNMNPFDFTRIAAKVDELIINSKIEINIELKNTLKSFGHFIGEISDENMTISPSRTTNFEMFKPYLADLYDSWLARIK